MLGSAPRRILPLGLWCALIACSPRPAADAADAAAPAPAPLEAGAPPPVVPTAFVAVACLKTPRRSHTATLLLDGRVLVTGGEDAAGSMLASAEIFDPATRSFTSTKPMPEARSLQTATLVADGRVLVVGGGESNAIGAPSGSGVSPDALLYDPTADTWTRTPKLQIARHGHTATLLADGTVLIVGGARDESVVGPVFGGPATDKFGKAVAEAELYDPAAGSWTPARSMGVARFLHTANLLADGRVLVAGGGTEVNEVSFKSAEIYDPRSKAWSVTGSFAGEDRVFHASARLPSGAVLVVGGKQSNIKFLATTELFDPTGGAWSAMPARDAAATAPTLTPLADGRVLVAGGNSCGSKGCTALTSAQIFDESTRSWSAFPKLLGGRVLHSVTRLRSGELLVVGGSDGGGALVSTCELATAAE